MEQFLLQIFSVIHQIPIGKVTTYGDVAKMSGFPGYARQVGKALSQLPDGSRLPWYRVINSKGKLSLQGENMLRQKEKLEKEGVEVSENGKINLKKYRWHP
ncbi:hypothetical protein DI392_03750 [Vibrio albus]|uniref:Methylated-DNA-[protein]-cysteine S-methyltransferase DNA binding domain-containing protein n=1 Tax=Vibrio albus TaxID=2200953 RepID=A0A2U3BBR8_9VIBR|nr:MGMT family protein [Vibrio albus]PWI34241.1 hypothetical protein DI392_03750 [Vibrio albus]